MNVKREEPSEVRAIPPQVLASAANGVIDMIRRMGGDVDRIFGIARIDTTALDSPLNELSLKQYCELFEEAARQTQYDNFGLRFGHGFQPKRLGALGYLAINSPTMASGLRNLCEYFPAHQQGSTLALRQEGELLHLDYQIHDPSISRKRQDAELSLGMFTNIFRHCYGARWKPLEIHFEHSRPSEPKEHEALIEAPVIFSQRINSIVFRRSDLEGVMPNPDPYLFSLIEPFMRKRRTRPRPDDLVAMVRQKIETHFDNGNPRIKKVASELGLTSWTLHRRLRELDLSFQELVRDARRQLALRYLSEPALPVTEVALMLGYSELSAFTRAFRQWTGMSPARYRHLLVTAQSKQEQAL
jgi:AraC-like DNA-binding protein